MISHRPPRARPWPRMCARCSCTPSCTGHTLCAGAAGCPA